MFNTYIYAPKAVHDGINYLIDSVVDSTVKEATASPNNKPKGLLDMGAEMFTGAAIKRDLRQMAFNVVTAGALFQTANIVAAVAFSTCTLSAILVGAGLFYAREVIRENMGNTKLGSALLLDNKVRIKLEPSFLTNLFIIKSDTQKL
jgi:Pyruvate/2-oxoacid:ferredoxin oxidoreductase gamma subunit